MFSFYDWFMKPLEKRGIQQARKSLIPTAKGHVLEIGSGTGVNVKLYNQDIITSLTLSDIKLNKKLIFLLSSKLEDKSRNCKNRVIMICMLFNTFGVRFASSSLEKSSSSISSFAFSS